MQTPGKVIKTYNATAESYVATRIDELHKKHLDSLLLKGFANKNKDKGTCADFGCGPGQTTKFLVESGLDDIIGIDISPSMVDTARKYFTGIRFETGDLLLAYGDNYFGSAVAFYAIVHFDHPQLDDAFKEVNRVLKKGAQFLFSFHVGEGRVHFDKANEVEVDIDLFFWQMNVILELLNKNNFVIIDAIERLPYSEVEYPSRRGYVLAEKK